MYHSSNIIVVQNHLAAMDTAHAEPNDYPPGTEQGDDTVETVVRTVVFLHQNNDLVTHFWTVTDIDSQNNL